uniref:Peptidase M12A domain-containing protein n=1 Tax=Panagrolaimus superbus TaxID=310955 RepID=A0A914YTX8_9BILA
MQEKFLYLFCFFFCSFAFPTNVIERFIWNTKHIDFEVICEEEDRVMFFKLIYDTVTELNKGVGGQFLEWKELSPGEEYSKKRYMSFVLEKNGCGETDAVSKGGFYVPLSTSEKCSMVTNLRNLMASLGFIYTHLRQDRDQFIIIHYDNIYNVDKQIYQKCYDCMESTNSAFSVYDYTSILHFPQYSIYSKNASAPIFTPKQNNVEMDETWNDKHFTSQDALIFKAIYG